MELEDLLKNHIDKNYHSLATQRSYQTAISIFQRDTGLRNTNAISVEVVEQWKDQVLDRASGSTWNNYRRHLKSLYASAIRDKRLLIDNPFLLVRPISRPIERQKICSLLEITNAIKYIESSSETMKSGWFLIAVIRMLYYTGMRRRQLVGLMWGDINHANKTLRLSAAHSKTKKQWNIPVTDEVQGVLTSILNETRKVTGKQPAESSQIFNVTLFNGHFVGSQMTVEQITTMFRKLRRANFTLTPHKLRHTMATEICNSADVGEGTVKLRTLQEQLGHADINTTAKYMRPSVKAQAEMLSRLKRI